MPRFGSTVARWSLACLIGASAAVLPSCAGHSLPRDGARDKDRVEVVRTYRGYASYYGAGFAGQRTASGRRFDPGEMVAAHRTLPLGTRVRVTNLANGRSVILRVIDRGPYAGRNTIIDVSEGAARRLGFIRAGRTRVTVEVLAQDADEEH
ncbi:MAG TPA: septal ring lytic transglycosylase RlpA family protein [Vicinamibacterales bacterium]|nr:septal ring lytic transglycosylase RlpA family protein [Vicinamibacterales bacterium]